MGRNGNGNRRVSSTVENILYVRRRTVQSKLFLSLDILPTVLLRNGGVLVYLSHDPLLKFRSGKGAADEVRGLKIFRHWRGFENCLRWCPISQVVHRK